MTRQLTEKQKQFCKNIVAGMTQKDAYINAYNHTGSKQVAYNESSKLMLNKSVQEYIKSISKPLEQAFNVSVLTDRQKQINEIHDRIKICKQKDDETNIRYYLDMLNKLYGLYKDSDTTEKQENNISKLDTSTLLKITSA